MHERVDEEVGQVRLGEKEGGFRPRDCKEVIDWAGVGLREGTQGTRGGLT